MRTGNFVASVHVSEYSFGSFFVRDDALLPSQQFTGNTASKGIYSEPCHILAI